MFLATLRFLKFFVAFIIKITFTKGCGEFLDKIFWIQRICIQIKNYPSYKLWKR